MQLNTQISAVLRGAVSRGIKAAEVDARGNLVFTLTDNSRLDMGMVHGTDITKVEQTVTGSGDGGENTITVTLSDGTEHSFTIRNGSKGDRGDGFILLGIYATEAELRAVHPTGSRGDAYAIGTATSCEVYIWDIDAGDWRNVGQLKGAKGDTGATGAAGADGVSATHSWDGTVLTVTSASGTSSADLKGAPGAPGEKGDTGAPGPKGDALFASGLTSADTIEESASIPFIDSASANRKTTWANIKNLLNQGLIVTSNYFVAENGVTRRSRRFSAFIGCLCDDRLGNNGNIHIVHEIEENLHFLLALAAGLVRGIDNDLLDILVHNGLCQFFYIHIFLCQSDKGIQTVVHFFPLFHPFFDNFNFEF